MDRRTIAQAIAALGIGEPNSRWAAVREAETLLLYLNLLAPATHGCATASPLPFDGATKPRAAITPFFPVATDAASTGRIRPLPFRNQDHVAWLQGPLTRLWHQDQLPKHPCAWIIAGPRDRRDLVWS